MNSITMTVELCAEDRARLDKILEALTGHDCHNCVQNVAEYCCSKLPTAAEPAPATSAEPEQPTVDTPEPEKPAEGQETAKAEPVEEQPQASRADIQKKVVDLSAAGKKAQVRDIVLAYDNTKVSDIPEDKLAEVWQKLTALEG